MSIGSDTVMTVALDSHQIPYYLPGKKPFVPYFRYSVKDKYSIKGEEMQEGKGYYENKKTRCVDTSFQTVDKPLDYIKMGSQGRSPRQGLGAVAPVI